MDALGHSSDKYLVNTHYRQASNEVLQRQTNKSLSLSQEQLWDFKSIPPLKSVHSFIHSFVKTQSDLPPNYPSIYLPTTNPPIHPSIHPPIQPANHPSIHPSLLLNFSVTLGKSLSFPKPVSSSMGVIISTS